MITDVSNSRMVCGSLCSSSDILSMKFKHRPIEIGDYLLFYNAGAYNLQEASNLFLGMEMPGILRYNLVFDTLRIK